MFSPLARFLCDACILPSPSFTGVHHWVFSKVVLDVTLFFKNVYGLWSLTGSSAANYRQLGYLLKDDAPFFFFSRAIPYAVSSHSRELGPDVIQLTFPYLRIFILLVLFFS